MKKQILKMLSIILCATTLMPARSVVWAAGDDDKNDSKTPTSVNESKTSSEEENVQVFDGEKSKETDEGIKLCLFGGSDKEITVKKPKIRKTNRSQRARKRQEARKTTKRYRFLSQ
ncbi:MAG: hypothetical protein IJJ04_01530, partial [Clostridia bacterium]|nr:hypothetical protein [Clostridia bacterium]